MSVRVDKPPHRLRRPYMWPAIGLLIVAGVGVAAQRAFFSGGAHYSWPPRPCVVHGVPARCGTFVVPESRAKPDGRTIGLRVVVLPAVSQPVREDAVAYLAGGPGSAATDDADVRSQQLELLNSHRDILLVDQRGTGGSTRQHPDVTQYGTRMAMDDLDAVRRALGYRQLDLIGSSYGATAAQVYVRRYPSAVRALVLAAGTALDVPFFVHYAGNAQRALDQLANLCASQADCRRAFPNWQQQFGALVEAWNAHPMHGMSGDTFASIIHAMLLNADKAVSVPLVVSSAARGNYTPLKRAGNGDLPFTIGLMASIWCNEPWTGLQAKGPWGTQFDSYATAQIASVQHQCKASPRRAEPRSLWTLPTRSHVPVLALVGGADPQDPVGNLAALKHHFPDSRIVVFPHVGHDFNIGGCVDQMMEQLADQGTAKAVDVTLCSGAVAVPAFPLDG